MAAERGMGRGLAAILSGAPAGISAARGTPDVELRELPVGLIVPNPRQPRRLFDEESLVALAESLKARGVLQPVIVRPAGEETWELVAGERRWRAARLAGRPTIPALIRAHDDAGSLEVALIENMAREDLNPVEQASACQALIDELGWSREEIGRRVGRSRVAISNLLRLLDLPEDVLLLIEEGSLAEGHGRALLLAPDHEERRRLGHAAAEAGWTVRHTEDAARATIADVEPDVRRAAAKPRPSADQHDAARRLADALGRSWGTDVSVTPKGDGFTVTIRLASYDEAVALAERTAALEAA